MATKTFEIAGLDTDQIGIESGQLKDLSSRIGGSLLTEGDDGWEDATHLWNASIKKKPALVVQPTSTKDVVTVVEFARDKGILLSVKGGGHNIAGTAVADGGLMLDMSRLCDVTVDPDARLARVGPGCVLGDVDGATQQHGLATTLGFVSKTGVAGLTLGGGFGYLMRRFGWAADNLEEVEIVTADGAVRTGSRQEEPELFWALRGGGGNLGIVTRFTFGLHEVGPMITGGLMLWGGERADDVLGAYQALTASAPRELTAATMIRLAPPAPFVPEEMHFKPVIGVMVCHSGPDPDRDLAPLRDVGDPIADLIQEHPYAVQQSMMDDLDPDGLNQYWKTEFLPDVSPDYLDTFRDAALKVASPMSYSVIFHIGGVNNEREADDGAVGNRDARFISGFSGVWPPNQVGDEIVSAVREGWEKIRPFSTGGNYVNFQHAEDDEKRTAAAYGRNLERLRRVKATYDPGNLFRVNRNISPAS